MDLVKQNIASMALMPQHCPLTPNSYTSFFNDMNELSEGVAPYQMRLLKSKHPRDGFPTQTLKSNNFYTHWKQDALKWYPASSKEFAVNEQDKMVERIQQDKSTELYKATRRRNAYAIPLPTNGINQVGILFNEKCNAPTFTYSRFAVQPINNSSWIDNSLYKNDISQETLQQKKQYIDTITQNNKDLYRSVFEDMFIMESKPSNLDNSDN